LGSEPKYLISKLNFSSLKKIEKYFQKKRVEKIFYDKNSFSLSKKKL